MVMAVVKDTQRSDLQQQPCRNTLRHSFIFTLGGLENLLNQKKKMKPLDKKMPNS